MCFPFLIQMFGIVKTVSVSRISEKKRFYLKNHTYFHSISEYGFFPPFPEMFVEKELGKLQKYSLRWIPISKILPLKPKVGTQYPMVFSIPLSMWQLLSHPVYIWAIAGGDILPLLRLQLRIRDQVLLISASHLCPWSLGRTDLIILFVLLDPTIPEPDLRTSESSKPINSSFA